MKPFDAAFWHGMLARIAGDPPSDNVLATPILHKIQQYLQVREHLEEAPDPVRTWNFYKEILDDMVHTGGGDGFMLVLMDLEPFYEAPTGSYQQKDGSIEKAWWRLLPDKG